MSSRSESDSESNRSGSPIHQGPAPTPGHGLDRSASNSPQYARSQEPSPDRAGSRISRSRSRSGTPASSARSRSGSGDSNKSAASQRSGGSNNSRKSRSRSAASNRSKGSQSAESNRSGSAASQKSAQGSRRSGSNRSESPAGSHRSRSSSAGSKKTRSRSGSAVSKKSRSRSGSAASKKSRSRSGSAGSKKSRSRSASAGSKKSRSRSGSAGSKKSRSRSGSAASNKTRSRSGSAASNKSGSRSRSPSRSRSGSAASNRSKSAESNRSKSQESNRSRRSQSRSRSPSREKAAEARSRSNSPNLQIDEPGSPESQKGEKRQRDSSEERGTKKKSRVIDSDSEGEDKDDKGVSAAAIFGDADDISSEEEKDKAESDREARRSDDDEERRRSEDENEERHVEEDEDKENEPEPIPETRIDVEIPKISCDLGRDINFVKLPNFLSVETRPFDPETYEDEIDEEETLDEEGRARLKLKVENTIRWREVMDKEGSVKKESNARLVRWSDGSYSLHLGSEIFDVYKQPLQGDHNHLFIRQGTGLQGQAVFRTKLSFRPHSTESFTHRKMTLSLADRSQKTSGIKILSQVGADPDHDRKNLLKKEEEKLKQTVRVSKPRRKGDGVTRSHNTSVYREEDGSDEEGAISLNAIKNKYKSGAAPSAKGGAIYSSDEEGSDIEARRARKLDKAKVLKDSDSSDDSE